MTSSQIGYRVVSTYVRGDNLLRWKVQQYSEEGESRWCDSAFHGINFFNTASEAVKKMEELLLRRQIQ